MKFIFYIAGRYLFSKKKSRAVNLITAISMTGVAVGTAAMIIVLSAFNGLEDLVRSFYQTFDPDLKVSIDRGKHFTLPEDTLVLIHEIEGIDQISLVMEEKALLRYRDQEYIATLKGVDENYLNTTDMARALTRGKFEPQNQEVLTAAMGLGVAYHLGVYISDEPVSLDAYVPREGFNPMLDPTQAFTNRKIRTTGFFSVQPDFDVKYVLTTLAFVRELTHSPELISAIEIKLKNPRNEKAVRQKLTDLLGDGYIIENRDEQQALLFKVMKTEGLVTFLILAFILAVASFTILGSLVMLILDKKDDLKTLWNLGASNAQLRRLIRLEGMLIAAVGGFAGLLLGVLLVWLQHQFGLVILGQGYVVEAYPVELRFYDVLLVMATVFTIAWVITWLAAKNLKVQKV